MPAQTILLDCSVDPASLSSLGAQQTLSGNVQSALSEFLPGLQQIHFHEMDRGFLCVCTALGGIVVTVRGFPQGLLTINVEYFKDEEAPPLLSYEVWLNKLNDQGAPYIFLFSGGAPCNEQRCVTAVDRLITSISKHMSDISSSIL